jgi:alkylation response protein AidB-like acyl-CoA dehydrogenase
MGHYKSNLRDLEFNLFEVFGTRGVFGQGPFSDIDAETARSILAEVERLASGTVADSYIVGDRNPPTFDPDTASVHMPDAMEESYRRYMEAEFWRLDLPPELGGTKAPRMLWWSLSEMLLGANAPLVMAACGPSFAHTLWLEGTPEQKRWAQLFIDKQWGATMVLTEPDVGSDVGAATTKAYLQPDGSWHIVGVKRFITNGDHDLAGNIIHYVLARPVGVDGAGGPGTKGLSLFIVPKYHFDLETGELGDRNGVFATGVEKKMGLKGSPTCTLGFGQTEISAKGWLVGDKHDGIRQMFLIIEMARMMVGTKSTATLSTGYLNALEFAKVRVQGQELTQVAWNRNAPSVTIDNHPDVRRALMMQKAYAEGLRALLCYTSCWQDKATLARAAGDDQAALYADKLINCLQPIVKALCSERAYELLGHETLQTFGGSGFLQDYPIEQYVRDSKIDSLYEGTTAIQSNNLVFRQLSLSRKPAIVLVAEIQDFLDREAGGPELKEAREALAGAVAALQSVAILAKDWIEAAKSGQLKELNKLALNARRMLLALGDVLVAGLLARQAEVALTALESEGLTQADVYFYAGKVAAASFFCREILPRISSDAAIIRGTSLDIMSLPIGAF